MRKKILIAEPREVIRVGIRTLLEQSNQAVEIYEAFTCEDMQKILHSYSIELALIHQSFVVDLNVLPAHKLILLIDELEMEGFIDAYKRKIRGYLSTRVSTEILLAAVNSAEDTCLLDPVFLPWVMENLVKYMQGAHEVSVLSHREREITQLLQKGLDRRTVAQQLHITQATLKTHIRNIARKQEEAQQGSNLITYLPRQKSMIRDIS